MNKIKRDRRAQKALDELGSFECGKCSQKLLRNEDCCDKCGAVHCPYCKAYQDGWRGVCKHYVASVSDEFIEGFPCVDGYEDSTDERLLIDLLGDLSYETVEDDGATIYFSLHAQEVWAHINSLFG